SAVFGSPSGPTTFGGTPPLGRSMSMMVLIGTGVVVPTTCAETTLRKKSACAGLDGLVVAAVEGMTYSNCPTMAPSDSVSRVEPAGKDGTKIVDLVMQATSGSVDPRTSVALVRSIELEFFSRSDMRAVSPASANGSLSPPTSSTVFPRTMNSASGSLRHASVVLKGT